MSEQNDKPELAPSPPLQGEKVAFTGILASMTHHQAEELARQYGGDAMQHISQQTTMLVVGEEGWPLDLEGKPSQKYQQAIEAIGKGQPLRVVKESEWLHLLGLEQQRRDTQRLYTPAMLSHIMNLPVGMIRHWERTGLIHPVNKIYRLPYFDFQEVQSVKKLMELLESGVSFTEIQSSLKQLQEVFPDIEQPVLQLELLVHNDHLYYRDDLSLLEPKSGQRLFEFPTDSELTDSASTETNQILSINQGNGHHHNEQQHWNAGEWHEEGCRLLAADKATAAVDALRMCLMDRQDFADAHFHLAEALYRSGNRQGAIERYYTTVELDHDYIEAWTQLGCLQADAGDYQSAADAFQIALTIHPEYAEAHWHLANAFSQLNQTEEAIRHWKQYLAQDQRGPWAENARQSLQYAETEQTTT